MSMSRKPLQNKENKQIFGKQLNLEKNPMIYYAWNIACDWFLGCPPLFSIYPPHRLQKLLSNLEPIVAWRDILVTVLNSRKMRERARMEKLRRGT